MTVPMHPAPAPDHSARLFAITVIFLLVFLIVTHTPSDADMWWHLRDGQQMLSQRAILTTDAFSYTRFGSPWTNAFWLADLAMYAQFAAGGFLALALATSLLAVLALLVVYRQLSGPLGLRLGLLLLAGLAIAPVWSPRPQILSFLLLAILDYGLAGADAFFCRHPGWLAPFFALWANIHGGFIWGFLLLLATLAGDLLNRLSGAPNLLPGRQWARLALWSLVGAAAVCLNPNGVSLWKLPFQTISVSIANIAEWASPDFHRPDLHPILWLLFLLIIGLAFAKQTARGEHLLKALGFTYLTFVSQRNIGPFVIVTVPIVGYYLALAWREVQGRWTLAPAASGPPLPRALRLSVNAAIIFLLALFAVLRADWLSRPAALASGYPAGAVAWIRQASPPGRLFSSYNWGGYLDFELPQYPVFLDGRADLFGDQVFGEWEQIVNGTPQGMALLDRWNIKLVLLEPQWPLLQRLSVAGWKLLYQDQTALLFGR